MCFIRQHVFFALILVLGAYSSRVVSRVVLDATMRQRHKQWMDRCKRVYSSDFEKEKRFQIFKENVARIDGFNNANKKPYKLGVIKFADITNEEFRSTYNRYKDPYTENTDVADTAHTGGDASIEHNLSILDNPDWRKLEESCIVIDVDGCHSDALSRGKRRSYKKTIRDDFLSEKKASRAREYEKLAALYDDPKSTQDCSCESGKGETSDAHGSSECEWEIL